MGGWWRRFIYALIFLAFPKSGEAAEGPTIAGPIGGTDIRSALLPPPGFYGGLVLLGSPAFDFVDGSGNTVPGLEEARLTKYLGAPFLVYVAPVTVFGGSIGFAGIVPMGTICGRLFAYESSECNTGVGDPYVEFLWSRSFGHLRPSAFAGALPIHEGLTTAAGIGLVIPVGQFDSSSPTKQARSIGTNIFDLAPTIAATYTTPPWLVDGTEISAKLYWNEYFENPETDYSAGSIISLDFAVSERIGRAQMGLAGNYLVQIQDDQRSGVTVPPDGNRAEALTLGGVVGYDLPEYEAALKLKFQQTVFARNTVKFWGLTFSVIKAF